jgi:hypothetical protein
VVGTSDSACQQYPRMPLTGQAADGILHDRRVGGTFAL